MSKLLGYGATVCAVLAAAGCGSPPRSQDVSRAELVGIVRPVGERPTGMAVLSVNQPDGTPMNVEVDRGAFWDDSGITLPRTGN